MACPPRETFQIGWICALPIEAAAAKEMLDESFGTLDVQDPTDSNACTLGRIGKHHVVIACLPGGQYGTTSATTVANHMIRTFSKSLRIGLMVGVGGGIPSVAHDIRLGDVVISCPQGTTSGVLQYDMGKVGPGGSFDRTGSLNSPPRPLLTALNSMRAAELTDDPLFPGYIAKSTERNARTRRTFFRPGAHQDRLFKQEFDHPQGATECDSCQQDWEEMRTEREDTDPRPHYGIIASGNALIKDARTREQLRLKTGALCFEMEAAGLMMDFPCIVIRGICDYADTHKNEQWQGFAALAAASYAKELLGYVPVGHILQENLVIDGFEMIEDRLVRLHGQIARQHDEHQARVSTNLHQKCHQTFKIGKYTEQKDINPKKTDGTCQWVLQSSEYVRWSESNHNDFLLISADPGCGKSVLAKTIIDGYLDDPSPAATICYFFFKENEEQNNLAAAMCSILHQLFSQRPHLLDHAISSWKINGKALQNELDELWDIFIKATSSDPSSKIVCVLDALDECREVDRDKLIQNIRSLPQQTSHSQRDCQPTEVFHQTPDDSQPPPGNYLKFLVTSRPYHQIQNRFQNMDGFLYLHLKGEDENDQIRQEIDSVVRMRVKELAQTAKLELKVQQKLEKQLLKMENRTYLWLHLAIDDLRATFELSFSPDEELVQMTPPSVEKAYEKILSRVPSGQTNTVSRIFQIIMAARRPLTTREMAMALGISHKG
ncbi:unnamed protein product [Penicillium olsonii]|nr:unnamed protein product [Penicillium olsonii]